MEILNQDRDQGFHAPLLSEYIASISYLISDLFVMYVQSSINMIEEDFVFHKIELPRL